jgi:hypothetical protein
LERFMQNNEINWFKKWRNSDKMSKKIVAFSFDDTIKQEIRVVEILNK